MRTWILAFAVTAFSLSFFSAAATVATYRGWDSRSESRSPRWAEVFEDEEPVGRYQYASDVVGETLPVSIVYLAELAPGAAPPEGLPRWPAQGEVFTSPALVGTEAVPAAQGDSRYGKLVGLISPGGLTDPGERLVYVGAGERLTPENSQLITGFGSRLATQIGAMTYRQPIGTMLGLAGVLFMAPAAWLFIAALRIGATQRARRIRILGLLGGGPRAARSLLWGEARFPFAVGAFIATGTVLVLISRDVRLPGHYFVLQSADLRTHLVLILGSLVAGLVLTAFGCVTPLGPRAERPMLPSARARSGGDLWRGMLAPLAATATVISQNLALAAENFEIGTLALGAGTVATLALLPTSARSWIRGATLAARRRAWDDGSPGSLVGAAQLAARPRPAVTFGATAAILVIVLTTLYAFTTRIGQAEAEAITLQRTLGGQVVVIEPQSGGAAAQETLAALSADHALAGLVPATEEEAGLALVIDEASLEAFQVRPGDSAPDWLAYLVGDVPVQTGPVGDDATTLFVTRKDGDPVNLEQVRDVLGRTTVPMWYAELPAGGWQTGAAILSRQARWLTWFGVLGITVSLVALWAGYANELLRAVRSLAAVQLFAPDGRFARAALGWRIVAPVAVTVLSGGVLGLVLLIPPDPAGNLDLPVGFVVSVSAAAVVTGAVAWFVTWSACVRSARSVVLGLPEE